jgi:hypothetical protein
MREPSSIVDVPACGTRKGGETGVKVQSIRGPEHGSGPNAILGPAAFFSSGNFNKAGNFSGERPVNACIVEHNDGTKVAIASRG